MKYYGRFILLFLSLISALIYSLVGSIETMLFIPLIFLHGVLSWFIGSWYDKFKYLSYHDPLTGVYNRRYAYIHFQKKFKQAQYKNEKIGILNIDIDDFKAINDTYGHNYGDFILQELCRLITRNIRKKDILVRWGGDEFIVLFDNLDCTSAQNLINQINESLKTELHHCQDTNKPDMTISIGHSIYPEDGQNTSELLLIADKRMYKVKSKTKEASTS